MKIWKLFSILLFLSVGLAACALQVAEPQANPPIPAYTATLTPFQPGTGPNTIVEGQSFIPAATEAPEEKASEEPTKPAEAAPTSEPEKTAPPAPTKPPIQPTKAPSQKPTSEPTATKSTNPTSGPTATPKSTSTPKPTKTPVPPTATSSIPIPADPTATKTPIPPTPTNTSVPPTKVPPTSPPPSPSCSPGYNSGFESEVISLINAQRASQGLSSLSGNGALGSAARTHSTDMACNNFFSHTGSDGSNFVTRVARAGYGGTPMGETIAAGYGSPSAVVDGWMNSPPHREILMNPNATQIGVGYAYTSTSSYGAYWTAVTGR